MPRAPLTEQQRQVLRDRLAKGRETKRLNKEAERSRSALNEDPEVADPPVPAPERHSRSRIAAPLRLHIHTSWTENEWMSNPIDDCRARLAMLKVDFEVGCRIVGQRPDVNDPTRYHCYVCDHLVPEGKWAWKHDYLDRATNVYKSVVMCSQMCHTVFQNDIRRQIAFKDLITGIPTPAREEEVPA